MERSEIVEKVKVILQENGKLGREALGLEEESDLYDAGLSSHASVEVMLALEAVFDLEFPDSMLRREVFQSVGAISDAIEELYE